MAWYKKSSPSDVSDFDDMILVLERVIALNLHPSTLAKNLLSKPTLQVVRESSTLMF